MAERRALTARDVKGNVEGYSEMSDEAFARRFYSDRAELRDLGVALQNLALGRPGLVDEAPSATALRVEMRDPDYSPEMPGRLAKLETAISKQRTIKFSYRTMTSGKSSERTVNPYGLLHDRGVWYVVGADLDRDAIRTFRVSRIRGDIRFATRRERDFRVPAEFDIDVYRGRAAWQFGEIVGEARIEVRPETAWWVERAFADSGRVEDGVFVTEYASLPLLASWVLRQDGRANPLEPAELRREVAESLRRVRDAHEGEPSKPARESSAQRDTDGPVERSSGPVTPERFGLLQALLAYLLAACGEEKEAVIPAADIVERFQIPYE